jgi:hypothetical protein
MGGVRSASVVVECDRCKKEVMVTDEDQANHYRAFATREDPDDRMFVAILNPPSGEAQDVDFEYVCPKCSEAISTYLDKILMKKPKKGGKEEKADGEKTAGKKKSSKAKKAEEKNEEPAEEPETEEPEAPVAEENEEPAEEPENKGEEFEDDELFD